MQVLLLNMKDLQELRNILSNYSLLLNVGLDNVTNMLESIEPGITEVVSPAKIINGTIIDGQSVRTKFDTFKQVLKNIIDNLDKQIEQQKV